MNILITGAGSVMGQSLFRAANFSKYAADMTVFFTNSVPEPAGFHFDSTGFYKTKFGGNFMVPVAREATYLPAIKKICADCGIDLVFGGTEHEIYPLAHLREDADFGPKITGLSHKFVDITTDKLKLGGFFSAHGVEHPATGLFANVRGFAARYGFPIVAKPRSSSSSRNIVVMRNEADLARADFDLPENIVVQEYIGNENEEYTCGCYLDFISGRGSAIVMRRALTPDGASGFGEVVKDNGLEDYCLSIIEVLKKEGLEGGAFNVQLRLRDGRPSAFEINGRYSSTEGPRARLGFNAVEATIENCLFGRAYDGFRPRIGSRFRRYYEEVYW